MLLSIGALSFIVMKEKRNPGLDTFIAGGSEKIVGVNRTEIPDDMY